MLSLSLDIKITYPVEFLGQNKPNFHMTFLVVVPAHINLKSQNQSAKLQHEGGVT
jgi:hypothetical protein